MDHEDLIQELPSIERLSNQERLKLAHRRRVAQLKKYQQYEKDLGSKKNKLLQQSEQQRRARARNHAPRVRFKNNIMLLEAAGRNDVDEVRKLLEAGVDPDVANEDGLTALHQCCIDDNEEMLKLLLEFGANVNAEDSERWSPLHAASTCGHLHLVKLLIASGANLLAVNAEGNMPYDICDEEATLDYIESEMAKRGVTQELIEEIRALPETKMLEDMKVIAQSGGDLECRDGDGATPLHIAAANGYLRVVEFLLDNHVSTEVVCKDNWQPIHAAACWGHIDVLELLVQNGADLNARTKNNETPYAICEDPEIKERIIQLRSEQETKAQDAARRKIRRSQSSNSRTQSIRRTSHRDKGLTSKKDAADEAQMLMAREINIKKKEDDDNVLIYELAQDWDSLRDPTEGKVNGKVNPGESYHQTTAELKMKDNSPSPTTEIGLNGQAVSSTNGTTTSHQKAHQDSEEDPEADGNKKQSNSSLPPAVYHGKDSVSQIKLTAQERERLRGLANNNPPLINTTNYKNNDTSNNNYKNNNKLNHHHHHEKYNPPPPSLMDNNETSSKDLVCPTPVETNANVQVKGGKNMPALYGSTDSVGGNSTIDIHVSVTINTTNSPTSTLNGGGSGGSILNGGTIISSSSCSPSFPMILNNSYTAPGTLADLKKQRSLQYLNRNHPLSLNGLTDMQPKQYEISPPSPTTRRKFVGDPEGHLADYTESGKRCCVIT